MAYTTIDDPSAYFQVVLYSGNGSDDRDIALGTTQFAPNLTVIKRRDDTNSWKCFDTVRGATKQVIWDGENAESTFADGLQAFNSDGFEVGTDEAVNDGSGTYLSLNWKESATAGFDIVAYTGNGTDDTDIAHSLSAVPHVMLVKCRTHGEYWAVYHHKNTSAPNTDYLLLNVSNATNDAADRWSDETPTSSVFTLGDNPHVNGNTKTYINYLFSEIQGYSKFGFYDGSGSSDGPYIYLGFRPAWLMIKCNSNAHASAGWRIWNNKMDTFNPADNVLDANTTAAEDLTGEDYDFLSNGFKVRAGGLKNNDAGETYVYMAFAEQPFVNSKGVPANAR